MSYGSERTKTPGVVLDFDLGPGIACLLCCTVQDGYNGSGQRAEQGGGLLKAPPGALRARTCFPDRYNKMIGISQLFGRDGSHRDNYDRLIFKGEGNRKEKSI